MKASTIRELLERGFSVSVTKPTGIVEKYHTLKNGDLAVTYSGMGICMYCGRRSRGMCSCNQTIETVSLTGAFRHLNEAATGSITSIDQARKLLTIN